MRLNHDIWHQVLQHFESDTDDKDRAEKQTVLLNMAVVSRTLSTLALTALWKNMDSLQPIVDVINFFASVPEEPLLVRAEEEKGYWELLRKGLDGDQIDLRVKAYLGRIQLLHMGGENEWEHALLPILIAWFGKGEPLLPNLKHLMVAFIDGFPTSYNIIPLILPPGLETIETSLASGSQCSTMITFYQLLLPTCRSLQTMKYYGEFFPSLLPTLTSFKNLRNLNVTHHRRTVQRTSPLSLPELLQQLTLLKYLSVDLGTLPIRTPKSSARLECHSLLGLQLDGTADELRASISSELICPSLKVLALVIRSGRGLSWKLLFDKVVSNFPATCSLYVMVEAPDFPELAMPDLQELLSLPLTRLVLEDVQNSLVQEDLQHMANAWPKLTTLTLTGCNTCLDASALLSEFPFLALRTLELPLDLTTFTSPLHGLPATRKNKLRKLGICSLTRFPPTLKEKIALARNLLTVCPNLKTVSVEATAVGITSEARDLQDILAGIRDMVATPSN